MRKVACVFLVLGALMPFVSWWWMERARLAYIARFGEHPEGKGLAAIVILGILVMIVFWAISTICAIRAYRAVPAPRPRRRDIELALMCVPPALLACFLMYVVIEMRSNRVEVIQIP